MKLFRNPVFAVFFCLLLIVGSTCLSAKIKMGNRYDRLCDELYEEILDFADENGLGELKSRAYAAHVERDCSGMISAYNELSAGKYYDDADDVYDAIRDYTKFQRKIQKFPASFFIDLLHITF